MSDLTPNPEPETAEPIEGEEDGEATADTEGMGPTEAENEGSEAD